MYLPFPSTLSLIVTFCHRLTSCFPPPSLPTWLSYFSFTSPSSSSYLTLGQCVLEEMASREALLGRLRGKAHRLWEEQAAGKGFVHRVSQLSAQYLALSNLTKVTLRPSCNPANLIHLLFQLNTTEPSLLPCCLPLFSLILNGMHYSPVAHLSWLL